MALFDLIVVIPFSDLLSMSNMGDLAKPSNLFNSRLIFTKEFLTFIKKHISGGKATNVMGSTKSVVEIPPSTANAQLKKSWSALGSRLLLVPTSALNLFKILPRGFVSKNSIFARKTDCVILFVEVLWSLNAEMKRGKRSKGSQKADNPSQNNCEA